VLRLRASERVREADRDVVGPLPEMQSGWR
jgi:hypothetical protein